MTGATDHLVFYRDQLVNLWRCGLLSELTLTTELAMIDEELWNGGEPWGEDDD